MRRSPGVAGPNALALALRHTLTGSAFLTSATQWATVYAVHQASSGLTTLAAAAATGATSISMDAAPAQFDYLYFPFTTTLASAASQGATSVSLNAAPVIGTQILVGMWTQPMVVSGVSGAGPYAVTLQAPEGASYSGLVVGATADAPVSGVHMPHQVTSVSGTGPYTATISPPIQLFELSASYPAGWPIGRLATIDVWLDNIIPVRNADGTPQLQNPSAPAGTQQLYITTGVRPARSYSPAVGDQCLVSRSSMSTGAGSDRVAIAAL